MISANRFVSLTLTVLSLAHFSKNCEPQKLFCGPGQRFQRAEGHFQKDTCKPCTHGRFMDKVRHRFTHCNECSFFDETSDIRKLLVDDCTRFHDIVTRCIPGFYKNEHNDCFSCTPCADLKQKKFTGQNCTLTSDTICCDKEDQLVLKNGTCVAPEYFCSPGEILLEGSRCLKCEDCTRCLAKSNETSRNEAYGQVPKDRGNGNDAEFCMPIGLFVVLLVLVGVEFSVLFILAWLFRQKLWMYCKSLLQKCRGLELVPQSDSAQGHRQSGQAADMRQ
ncbi:hypothetical protein ElyMa_006940900 [Elysia marginata]|uniref:TNFR-Cys domain-containing protein n=1 Tax=Elysia marginata TaxID=1093978 RepID=A0AAV4JHB1_9GAST|nr:hypothetical protein ElyMa_006940900 [Elysia marginata]